MRAAQPRVVQGVRVPGLHHGEGAGLQGRRRQVRAVVEVQQQEQPQHRCVQHRDMYHVFPESHVLPVCVESINADVW